MEGSDQTSLSDRPKEQLVFGGKAYPRGTTFMGIMPTGDLGPAAIFSMTDLCRFDEGTIRKELIRKVYVIFLVMSAITFCVIWTFPSNNRFHSGMSRAFGQNYGLLGSCGGVVLFCIFVLSYIDELRLEFPSNIMLLVILGAFETCTLGVVSLAYSTDKILFSVGFALALFLALTFVAAVVPRLDFTIIPSIIVSILVSPFLFGSVVIAFKTPAGIMGYSITGMVMLSLHLLYNTQLLLGRGMYKLAREEYVYPALNLYVDLLNMYLFFVNTIYYNKLT